MIDVGARPGGATTATATTAAAALRFHLEHGAGWDQQTQRQVAEKAKRRTVHQGPPSDGGHQSITGTTSIRSASGGAVNSNNEGSAGNVIDHLLKRAV
jgi:hypothetical protein